MNPVGLSSWHLLWWCTVLKHLAYVVQYAVNCYARLNDTFFEVYLLVLWTILKDFEELALTHSYMCYSATSLFI
jgi:hypothetical protein